VSGTRAGRRRPGAAAERLSWGRRRRTGLPDVAGKPGPHGPRIEVQANVRIAVGSDSTAASSSSSAQWPRTRPVGSANAITGSPSPPRTPDS